MEIRVVGYLDQKILVNEDEWRKALEDNELDKFMDPILRKLNVEITYGETGEFDGGLDSY